MEASPERPGLCIADSQELWDSGDRIQVLTNPNGRKGHLFMQWCESNAQVMWFCFCVWVVVSTFVLIQVMNFRIRFATINGA